MTRGVARDAGCGGCEYRIAVGVVNTDRDYHALSTFSYLEGIKKIRNLSNNIDIPSG